MRLIDADQLDQYAYFTEQPTYDAPYGGDYVVKMDDIENAPTINPEDLRPKGKWIAKEIMVRSPLARNYYCSQCKYEPLETINFCPNCGAKMEG